MKGYTQIYTGNGKGKSTAAFGLALRAAGAGKKVFIGQFVKGRPYAEIKAFRSFLPDIELEQFGRGCFIVRKPGAEDRAAAIKGLEKVQALVASGNYDLVILDEVNIALHYKLIPEEAVVQILNNKPAHVELVLTGRYAPKALIDMADLVTEMKEIRHYYSKGVEAREGIEF